MTHTGKHNGYKKKAIREADRLSLNTRYDSHLTRYKEYADETECLYHETYKQKQEKDSYTGTTGAIGLVQRTY